MYTDIFEFYNEEEWEEYSPILQELGYKWVDGDSLTKWSPYKKSRYRREYSLGEHLIICSQHKICSHCRLSDALLFDKKPTHITDFPDVFKETFNHVSLEEVLAI